jgi:fatty acid desaturase
LGGVPLSLFVPYSLYRRTHLWHHRFGGRILTDPIVDPDSFYLKQGFMAKASLPVRFVCRALGEGREWRIWAAHGVAGATLLLWVVGICKINVFVYIACFVYPGQALTLLRSSAEHRADADPAQRTAVVEANPLLSLIFLYTTLFGRRLLATPSLRCLPISRFGVGK